DDGKQYDYSREHECKAGMAHLFDEWGPGIDPDSCQEQSKPKVAQDLICGGRQVPDDRTGAAEPTEDERDHERTSGKAERDGPDAGDRDRNETDERSERNS